MRKERIINMLSNCDEMPVTVKLPHEVKKVAYLARVPYDKHMLLLVTDRHDFRVDTENMVTSGNILRCLENNPELTEIRIANPERVSKQIWDIESKDIIRTRKDGNVVILNAAIEFCARIYCKGEALTLLVGNYQLEEEAIAAAESYIAKDMAEINKVVREQWFTPLDRDDYEYEIIVR